jgi:hypothetical protein
MEQYNRIHLLLDRDTAGSNATKKALGWNPDKYIDRSNFYHGRKDLNEWLIHPPRATAWTKPKPAERPLYLVFITHIFPNNINLTSWQT